MHCCDGERVHAIQIMFLTSVEQQVLFHQGKGKYRKYHPTNIEFNRLIATNRLLGLTRRKLIVIKELINWSQWPCNTLLKIHQNQKLIL
jgi:hypothetical protein